MNQNSTTDGHKNNGKKKSVTKNTCRRRKAAGDEDDYVPFGCKRSKKEPDESNDDSDIDDEPISRGRERSSSGKGSSIGRWSGSEREKSLAARDIDQEIKMLTAKKLKAEIKEKEGQAKFYSDVSYGFQKLINKTDQLIDAISGIRTLIENKFQ